jgi:DNA-binding NarL/FixJ family response regulator
MREAKIWSQLLATKGVYFSLFDNLGNIKLELSVIKEISRDEYKIDFLDVVKIPLDEGRHSLANIWGAYQMDKMANINTLRNNAALSQNQHKLYFKYMAAFNYDMKMPPIKDVGPIDIGEPNVIDAKDKRILLIDDEADKGWEIVLQKIFSQAKDFIVIKEKVKDFDDFSAQSKQIIENESFDLYLVDLRLNGLDEEGTSKTNDFSGMKVLQKIKTLNRGHQVIMFTASNKVWNLKALLDAGADGYYLKESPEYGFSTAFSQQNYHRFQEDVKNCFERNYLKKIHTGIQQINKNLSTDELHGRIRNQLGLFWEMVLNAKTKAQFAYAYIALYMVIEIINNGLVKPAADSKWEIDGCGNLVDWHWNKETRQYENTGGEIVNNNPAEWKKFAGVYFQKWKGTDQQFIQDVYRLIEKRNGFVHNVKNILDKQDKKGQFLNRDIYAKEGIIKLFEAINTIITFLN